MDLTEWIFGKDPNCILCGKDTLPSPYGMCPDCLQDFPFAESALDQKAMSVCRYEGAAKQLIYDYKYNQKRYLGKYMAQMMAMSVLKTGQSYDVILTVPCSKRRKKVRGFDHTLYMARILSDNLNISPIQKGGIILRKKETRRLKGLTKQERLTELEAAFMVENGEKFLNKRLLIVDDILTTGATLSACTQAVLPYQPACVHWLTFASVL